MAYRRRGLGALTLPQAIFRQEGTQDASGNWVTSSLGYRLNNPGNLNFAGQPNCWQSGQGNGSEAQCATMADGIAATNRQLALDASRGLTLAQRLQTWATGNPSAYVQNVSGWMGVDPNTPLSQILGAPDASSSPANPSQGFDTWPTIDSYILGGQSDGQLSGMALAGLALAGIAALWAVS